ncbi:MAG TPA: methionyl-tRNA formyltransferase [Spirochaetia bacterium]|nr:methionyl-tRNA formyltransferase [Spirochaetia bacterium]
MRILFAGTPEFALPSLNALQTRFHVVGVLTQPAAAKGRRKRPVLSPVAAAAHSHAIPVFEPERIDEEFRITVASLAPDLLVCAAYGKIFKKDFLDVFPLGGINVHPSLLPRHRGPSPIPAAILSGDAMTGVSIQRLALAMDSGAILARQSFPLSGEETTGNLSPRLAEMGALLLPSVIEQIAAGTVREIEQNPEEATYCRLLRKEDGKISFVDSALHISRMIRAYNPWPFAYTFWQRSRLFFLKGGVYPHPVPDTAHAVPGLVLGMDKNVGFLIHTCKGILSVSELQREYKKPLFFKDFYNGNRDFPGSVCGGP